MAQTENNSGAETALNQKMPRVSELNIGLQILWIFYGKNIIAAEKSNEIISLTSRSV